MVEATQRTARLPLLPPAPASFAHIRRGWDEQLGLPVARLLPGEYYVTSHDEAIFTVLGSCVSACVRDRILGIGGMNHFMLPADLSNGNSTWPDEALNSITRYGNVAMERLIDDLLRLGGHREDLEFKVMGGGKVLDITLDVGAQNAAFVRQFLKREGFTIAAEDLGESFARKVLYNPRTGKVRVKRLTSTVNRAVFEREFKSKPAPAPVESPSAEAF